MSFSESKLLVSKNAFEGLASTISGILEVPMTKQLGKYFGVPSIQRRVNRSTYVDVLERVQNKLKDWKSKCLSTATRVTLVKAVTFAIPSYIMQSASLPKTIYANIEKHNRQFI